MNTTQPNRAHRRESGLVKRPWLSRKFSGSKARSGIGGFYARLRSETGAATAEYAITTLAAVGFAGLLVVILRSGEVRGILTDLVRSALSIPA